VAVWQVADDVRQSAAPAAAPPVSVTGLLRRKEESEKTARTNGNGTAAARLTPTGSEGPVARFGGRQKTLATG